MSSHALVSLAACAQRAPAVIGCGMARVALGCRRSAGYVASASMRQAETVDDLWGLFTRAAEKMDLNRADMVLLSFPPGKPTISFRWRNGKGNGNDGQPADDVLWSVMLPLRLNGHHLGRLHVRKATNGHPLGPEVPDTLQLLTKALAVNLDRIALGGPIVQQGQHTIERPESTETGVHEGS